MRSVGTLHWISVQVTIRTLTNSFYLFYLSVFIMESATCILQYIQKTEEFQHQAGIHLVEDIQCLTLDPKLATLYQHAHSYPYLLAPISQISDQSNYIILVKKWGYQLSTLSPSQIQSYSRQSWLPTVLNAFKGMNCTLPKITNEFIFIENNVGPKFLPVTCCTEVDYLLDFRAVVKQLFWHSKAIVERADRVEGISDIEEWWQELQPRIGGQSLEKLVELRNLQPKGLGKLKIPLSQQQKQWILSFTIYKGGGSLSLVYDGDKCGFDPAPLLNAASKNQLLFLLQNSKRKRVAFWMPAKPEIAVGSLFGTYYPDKTRKSVLLGLDKRSVHPLRDEHFSVGLGSQILLSIGRADIVCSAFNCSNVSFFPCSYAVDEQRGVADPEGLLGKQFRLRQLQVYKIN